MLAAEALHKVNAAVLFLLWLCLCAGPAWVLGLLLLLQSFGSCCASW